MADFNFKQPVVAALAIAARGGKVLLVRRGKPPNVGLWGFPGGKVELGEPISVAACRELQEETGLEAEPGEYMPPIDIIETDSASGELLHFVLVPVRVLKLRGAISAGDDASEVGWFSLKDLEAQSSVLCQQVLELGRTVLA